MKIYLAHPITGLSYDEVMAYYNEMEEFLIDLGYTPLCPMTGKDYLRTEKKPLKAHSYGNPISADQAIVGRDLWMVRQSDIVLIDLTGAKSVSIGCVSELAWAFLLGKHTILVMEEDNVHRHAFMTMANVWFKDTDSARDYLMKLSKVNR